VTGDRRWTLEEANAALPDVASVLERMRELLAVARQARRAGAERLQGNGQARAPAVEAELRSALERLTRDGIVLRDPDAGLVDFPARLPDGREYLLCWVLGEPEVAWWHWPQDGFAGRRPLAEPPA
jgi:hypothetical protein